MCCVIGLWMKNKVDVLGNGVRNRYMKRNLNGKKEINKDLRRWKSLRNELKMKDGRKKEKKLEEGREGR